MTKFERILISAPPLSFLVRASKKLTPPGFEGVPLYEVLRFFRRQLSTSGLSERASAIAYNFVMSIPPTCLFLFTMIPALPFISKQNLKNEIHLLVDDVIPERMHNHTIIDIINDFIDEPRFGMISISFILSLFFASNGMMGVMRSFNRNYIGFAKRSGLTKRWIAIKLTMLLYALLLICLFLLISQNNFLKWLGIQDDAVRNVIIYGRWLFIIALVFYSYGFIYKYAPSTQKRWTLNSPGALLATMLSFIAMIGFSAFVNNFGKFDVLFGSVGTIIVLMIIIYLNSLIVLIGFEFNVSIKSLKAMAETREKQENVNSS